LEKQLEIGLLNVIQSAFARFWCNELFGSHPSILDRRASGFKAATPGKVKGKSVQNSELVLKLVAYVLLAPLS
jgi:hypothetical protein